MTDFGAGRMRITMVAGSDCDLMRVAPLLERLKRYYDFIDPLLIQTGRDRHSDLEKPVFDHLRLKRPDIYLDSGPGSQIQETAKLLVEFEKSLLESSPHLVVVVGDSNCALSAATVAAKSGVLVAHIESGLRSFDECQPGEMNRLMIDSLTDFHLVTEISGCWNLRNESFDEKSVFFVGNLLSDTIDNLEGLPAARPIREKLGLHQAGFAVLALFGREPAHDVKTMKNILEGVAGITGKIPVIFPCPAQTRITIDKYNLSSYFGENGIRLVDPADSFDLMKLESEAAFVLTDSGSVQEETTIFGVPCLTLCRSTERQATVQEGTNKLIGPFAERIAAAAESITEGYTKNGTMPKYWDGKVAERVADVILNIRRSLLDPRSVRKGTARLKTVGEAFTAE